VADEIKFEWDAANVEHIARHDVTPQEAQEVFANDPTELGSRFVDGEARFQLVGFSNSGRWLCVIITEREENIRVVTAYDAENRQIETYLRSKGNHL
jgi:uncharacterized DUF497 family protein